MSVVFPAEVLLLARFSGRETGQISISWQLVDNAFVFDWVEAGAPCAASPFRRGFGFRLIEQVVPSYFDGKGKIDFESEGVRFRLVGTIGGSGSSSGQAFSEQAQEPV